MKNHKIHKLTNRQAIVRHKSLFDMNSYFMVEAVPHGKGFTLQQRDIDIDEWYDTLKTLKIDFANNLVTAYCNHGFSFRDWWKSLRHQEESNNSNSNLL
jgi:hypothetical protein